MLEQESQTAESIAERLIGWLGGARASLELALYDVRLPGPVGDAVAEALRSALARGVRVRIAFNDETPGEDPRPFEPPPPSTEPHLLEALGLRAQGHPGVAGPHAPQVRGARRRRGVERLDELDAGLLDPAGERD